MLLGLSEPTKGHCRVLGADPLKEPLRVKAQVGYMAENMGIYRDLTARQNLKFVAELNKLKNAASAMDEVLEMVGLAEAADKKAGDFSRGMRQRLGLAEVLIKKPKLVFLDEPTLGLDPEGIAAIMELIERLPREMGLSVILSSHLLHLVSRVATRVGLLHRGKLLAEGAIAELAEKFGLPTDLEAVYRHCLRKAESPEVAESSVGAAR
jgi:ABC-2 type transport system ATP-binding protein